MGFFDSIKEKLTADAVKEGLKGVTNRDFHVHFHISINPTFVQKEKRD